jgi:3-carboxy-cis,cis-muconate cycloisomerase
MTVRLIDSLATTAPMEQIFSDESVLKAMLDFEAALARAEARLGVIPQSAADTITKAAQAKNFDIAALAQATLRAGTPGIPLVKALTEQVRTIDASAAGYVHWGATSQDIADTALVLLLKQAQPVLESDLAKLDRALSRLSEQHAGTVMLGRTLMQAAPPVTFGLKAAGWLAAIRRCHAYLQSNFADALVLQFGGAVGTLAALGNQGPAVAAALADDLAIACPDAPWHTHRDRLAVLVCVLGVLIGSLGKMARDISLLMQNEIAEVAEPGVDGRGGSSTMPHKRNPIGCTLTLAAANRVPGLVSSFLSGMIQENERGVGGWQAEWPTVTAIVQSAGLAVASMAEVAEGLTVDVDRMRSNIAATHGVVFAERAMILLGKALGRDTAHRILGEATRQSVAQQNNLAEVLTDALAEMPEITAHLDPTAIHSLEDPEQYLGVAETLRKQLLAPRGHQTSKTERK